MDTIGQKLDLLFRTVTKPDGTEYNHREVAEGIGNKASSAYLWRIRNDKPGAQKPGFEIIEALAEFFGVPTDYFSSNRPVTQEFEQDLELAAALRQAGVQRIALRSKELNEEGKKAVLEVIKHIRRAQGLDDEG
jgi:transcriptional regulator with XRE-family HTH domain